MKSKTLLQIAKENPRKENVKMDMPYSKELLELSVAYIKSEIRMAQFIKAYKISNPRLKINGGSCLYKIATILREGFEKGDLKIKA